MLQCNTYLRRFRDGKRGDVHWCIDPGSRVDFKTVQKNLLAHIESLRAIRLVSLNHQDPDIVGNLYALTRQNEHLAAVVSEDTWRLVQHLGWRPREVHFPTRYRGNRIKLPGNHQILAVPTPFCHCRGAMAFYDIEARVLFSGDLFGGLNEPGRVHLFGEERDWPGIAVFHQIYMPSRISTSFAIRQIRALQPPVEMIAPQHGFLLVGDFMHDVMDRLERLPVGIDRLSMELDHDFLDAYREVTRELLQISEIHLGQDELHRRVELISQHETASELIHISEGRIDVVARGIDALPLLVDAIAQSNPTFRNLLRHAVLMGCHARAAPLPNLSPGMDELGQMEWIGS